MDDRASMADELEHAEPASPDVVEAERREDVGDENVATGQPHDVDRPVAEQSAIKRTTSLLGDTRRGWE